MSPRKKPKKLTRNNLWRALLKARHRATVGFVGDIQGFGRSFMFVWAVHPEALPFNDTLNIEIAEEFNYHGRESKTFYEQFARCAAKFPAAMSANGDAAPLFGSQVAFPFAEESQCWGCDMALRPMRRK